MEGAARGGVRGEGGKGHNQHAWPRVHAGLAAHSSAHNKPREAPARRHNVPQTRNQAGCGRSMSTRWGRSAGTPRSPPSPARLGAGSRRTHGNQRPARRRAPTALPSAETRPNTTSVQEGQRHAAAAHSRARETGQERRVAAFKPRTSYHFVTCSCFRSLLHGGEAQTSSGRVDRVPQVQHHQLHDVGCRIAVRVPFRVRWRLLVLDGTAQPGSGEGCFEVVMSDRCCRGATPCTCHGRSARHPLLGMALCPCHAHA